MTLMSKLTISEPWDFEGPHGGNELSGRILKRIDSKTLLFRADEEVALSGLISRYWLLSTRYETQSFEAEPYQGTVNGALLPKANRGQAFYSIGLSECA
jgi:hypothetical protein